MLDWTLENLTADDVARLHRGRRETVAAAKAEIDAATARLRTDFHLGAAYEGPPGHVQGGVAALVLDHVLGAAASSQEKPRLTGTITLRYVRTTRLGNLHAEARIARIKGVKTYTVGHLADEQGVTVEAEGVFIQPRWARG